MDMPRLRDEHAPLKDYVGRWTGPEILYPNQFREDRQEAIGSFHFSMFGGGFFLQADYQEWQNGVPIYGGKGIFGYAPGAPGDERGYYTMYWFDSIGGMYPEPAKGTYQDGALVFQNQNPLGHGRYTYALLSDGQLHFSLEMSQDGTTWAPFMEGTYRRVGAP